MDSCRTWKESGQHTGPEQWVPFLNKATHSPLVTNFGLCLSHTYHYGILQVWSQRTRKNKDISEALWSLSSCLWCAEYTMQIWRRTAFFGFVWKQDATEWERQKKKKRGERKCHLKIRYYVSLSQGKKGLFQSCSGEARTRARQERWERSHLEFWHQRKKPIATLLKLFFLQTKLTPSSQLLSDRSSYCWEVNILPLTSFAVLS